MDQVNRKSVLGKGLKDISGLEGIKRRKEVAGVRPVADTTVSDTLDASHIIPLDSPVGTSPPLAQDITTTERWAKLRIQDRMRLGKELVHQREFHEAMDILNTVIADDPRTLDVWYQLGMAYVGLRMVDEARFCFYKEIKNNPDSLEARWAIAFLRIQEGDENRSPADV